MGIISHILNQGATTLVTIRNNMATKTIQVELVNHVDLEK
jgi:hypothetical protein